MTETLLSAVGLGQARGEIVREVMEPFEVMFGAEWSWGQSWVLPAWLWVLVGILAILGAWLLSVVARWIWTLVARLLERRRERRRFDGFMLGAPGTMYRGPSGVDRLESPPAPLPRPAPASAGMAAARRRQGSSGSGVRRGPVSSDSSSSSSGGSLPLYLGFYGDGHGSSGLGSDSGGSSFGGSSDGGSSSSGGSDSGGGGGGGCD